MEHDGSFGTPKRPSQPPTECSASDSPFASLTGLRSPHSEVSFTDRFIPRRSVANPQEVFSMQNLGSPFSKEIVDFTESEKDQLIYSALLEQRILNLDGPSPPEGSARPRTHGRILSFGQRRDGNPGVSLPSLDSEADVIQNNSRIVRFVQETRRVPRTPYKILDAPGVVDDFYKHVLDWSRKDFVVIALNETVYLFNNGTTVPTHEAEPQVFRVFVSAESIPTSVKCSPSGSRVAVGTEKGFTKVFDLEKEKEIGTLGSHESRVCCLSFQSEHFLTSGSRDTLIVNHDLRQRPGVPTLTFRKHLQEVCSLKWDSFSTYLASGGNENAVYVWDLRREVPIKCLTEHKAAVRALCWSPHQFGLLASGGGNNDKSIKLWSVSAAGEESVATLATDSQVCNILFSSHSNEMLTTHGFSKNQLMLWNVAKRERFSVIDAHQTRVLHAAYGPDGESVATCSADETLKFWRVFLRRKPVPATDRDSPFEKGSFTFR